MAHECTKEIMDGFRSRRCSRPATIEEKGRWYCAGHAPSNVARRRAERDAAYDRKAAVRDAEWEAEERMRESHPLLIAACDAALKHGMNAFWMEGDQMQNLHEQIRAALAEAKKETPDAGH